MFESDASTGRNQHRRDHELWLTMQAAYAQWMNATGALDDLTAGASGDAPSPDESLRVRKAAKEQRIAFQEYIEARLAFSEFLFARDSETRKGPSAGENSQEYLHETAPGLWNVQTTSKLALLALAVALLCPAVFALAYLMHERKHVRDLDAVRDAMSATLSQTPAPKPDAGNSPLQVAIQQDGRAPVALAGSTPAPRTAVQTPADNGHWRPIERPHAQQRKQTGSMATPYQALVQFRQRAQTNHYEFTLTPSWRYARIGPIRVSLYNLDHRHDYFDLSMMLGDFRLDRKHVRLYEPVWINLGGSSTPVRLLADRIGRNEVHGYLSSPKPRPAPAPSPRIKNAGSSTHG